MKATLLFILLVIGTSLKAGNDNTTYLVFMRNGTQLKGKITEVKKGKYIELVKEDGTKQKIDWDLCKGYLSVEEFNKLKAKHKDWPKCLLIIKGDTLNGKIKNSYVFDAKGGQLFINSANTEENAIFERGTITFASDDEQEWKLPPQNYSAFFVYNNKGTPEKYVSILDKTDGAYDVYKVLIEGKCTLLYCETSTGLSYATPAMGANGGRAHMETVTKSTSDHYIIYYKDVLTGMKTETQDGPNITTGFKKRCRQVFADCPSLIEIIENKVYKPDDLDAMVKEFNQCLDSKSTSGQKK